VRKPLIVFTPKSMLRHPDASSSIDEFTQPRFLPVVPDREVQDAKAHPHRQRQTRARTAPPSAAAAKDTSTAIIFSISSIRCSVRKIAAAIDEHPNAREVVWVQEEPKNMGAHFFVMPRIGQLVQSKA